MVTKSEEKEIDRVVKSKLLSYFIIFLAIITGIWGVSVWGIYLKVKDETHELIASQFAEPKIKATLEEVASNEARSIIMEKVEPEAQKAKEEIISIQNDLNEAQQKYDHQYRDMGRKLTNVELDVRDLKDRGSSALLAYKTYGGDKKSYAALVKMMKTSIGQPLEDNLKEQVLNIQITYATSEGGVRSINLCKPNVNCTKFEDENSERLDNIYDQFVHHSLVVSRAKAAYLLRITNNKRISNTNEAGGLQVSWEKIITSLVDAMVSPKEHLLVSVMALDTFRYLIPQFKTVSQVPTNESPETVFDFNKAQDYWKTNRQTILTELTRS